MSAGRMLASLVMGVSGGAGGGAWWEKRRRQGKAVATALRAERAFLTEYDRGAERTRAGAWREAAHSLARAADYLGSFKTARAAAPEWDPQSYRLLALQDCLYRLTDAVGDRKPAPARVTAAQADQVRG